jgi:hypothetical protein
VVEKKPNAEETEARPLDDADVNELAGGAPCGEEVDSVPVKW